MLKRELGASSGTQDQHRSKRRKETPVGTRGMLTLDSTQNGNGGDVEGGLVWKEQALRLWQTVRDATSKDGRALSPVFLRRPSKRQYPDYYVLIAQPIALDDIKKKIEDGEYDSLESVRQDFELCFKNAKQYNMKESVIWNDAKDLLKLTNKTYSKMIPHEDADDTAKEKSPSLTRLLKSRLQKLSNKTDETGRILVTEFMELPSKKIWPLYYQLIKEPMCIEVLLGRLKRKEYHSSADFARDVELIFSNAMSFNQEHTQIWEDALTLREYFRQLMSDLPEPFALPEEMRAAPKLKLKILVKSQAARDPPDSNLQVPQATSSSRHTIRVPPSTTTVLDGAAPAPQPTAAPLASSLKDSSPVATAAPPVRPLPAQSIITNRLSPLPPPVAHTHPPPTPAQPAIPAKPALPAPVARTPPVNPSQSTVATHQSSNSPAPPPPPERLPFKLILLKIEPTGRLIGLDHRDGVQSWVMRLAPGEKDVRVSRVMFLEDDADEASDAEDGEGDDTMEPAPKRKRGRPPKASKLKLAVKTPSKPKVHKRKPSFKLEDVQIKLNGQAKAASDSSTWSFELTAGPNVLEVAEKGGAAWKVYMERL